MWYLTFIWATLGITSSFILQSVTLQGALGSTELSRALAGIPRPLQQQAPAGPETAHK